MRRLLAALCALGALTLPAAGQGLDSYPVARPFNGVALLIVDQERVLSESLPGKDMLALNAAETEALRQEGQQLDRAFEAEERALTDRRPSLTPQEFRALADAFDEKVVRTRAEQQDKSAALGDRLDRRRLAFLRQVAPILAEMLVETGAAAVIDERATLVANEDLNITDEVIKRLDEAFLAGRAGGAGSEEKKD